MKDATTQLELRENAASSRRHASRRIDRTGKEQSLGAYAEESSLRFAASQERGNVATEERGERLLTIQQVADMLHVPVSWVYGRTRKRSVERLPGIRLGKYWRFSAVDVNAWIRARRTNHYHHD